MLTGARGALPEVVAQMERVDQLTPVWSGSSLVALRACALHNRAVL